MGFFARKLWTVAAVAALGAAADVSALDMSVGGGGFYAGNFGGGVNGSASTGNQTLKLEFKMPYTGYGAYFFVDAQYAAVSIGVGAGGGPWEVVATAESGQNVQSLKRQIDPLLVGLNFELLLKYPIAVLSNLILFPAVGIDYQSCITENVEGIGVANYNRAFAVDVPSSDLSRLWFKFGLGIDLLMSEHFFVRPVLLYGVGMKNTMEKNKLADNVVEPYLRSMLYGATDVSTNAISSHGLAVKIGAGYKF